MPNHVYVINILMWTLRYTYHGHAKHEIAGMSPQKGKRKGGAGAWENNIILLSVLA